MEADSHVAVKGLHTFAAGVGQGLKISGDAVLVRTPGGRTLAIVIAFGLAPNTTYGSHVHKAKCAAGDADGHYQFTPGGSADSVNEIWPGFRIEGVLCGRMHTRGMRRGRAGGSGDDEFMGDGRRVCAERRRRRTAVSVVIHAPGGAKIACADLA